MHSCIYFDFDIIQNKNGSVSNDPIKFYGVNECHPNSGVDAV